MTSTGREVPSNAARQDAASAVVVVGAGIVGASVAYHLARKSVPVTLLEQAPSPAAGVTGSSFAWIGDSGGDWPCGAQDLRPYVLADYRRLEAELPEFAVRWTGSLRWTGVPTMQQGQYLVGPDEIAVLEPHLREPPHRAVHTPTDGGVDPVAMAGALVRDARAHGAQVVYGASVTSIKPATGVQTSAGFHPATTVVLAAGAGTAALARSSLDLELGVSTSPACLLHIAAPPGLLKTIVAGPHFEAREVRDGELLATMPYAVGQPDDAVAREALNTLHRLQSAFDNGSACRLLSYHVCERPMPPAGPIVGHLTPDRSVYIAVMHSAVALAPTVGRLIAEELASDNPVGELRRCRPTRTPLR